MNMWLPKRCLSTCLPSKLSNSSLPWLTLLCPLYDPVTAGWWNECQVTRIPALDLCCFPKGRKGLDYDIYYLFRIVARFSKTATTSGQRMWIYSCLLSGLGSLLSYWRPCFLHNGFMAGSRHRIASTSSCSNQESFSCPKFVAREQNFFFASTGTSYVTDCLLTSLQACWCCLLNVWRKNLAPR